MTIYVVTILTKNAIALGDKGEQVDIPLSYALGMIGTLPAFETKEDALAFCNGREDLLVELEEIGEFIDER